MVIIAKKKTKQQLCHISYWLLNIIQTGPLVLSQFNIWTASYDEGKLRNESNRCVINETGDVFPWKQWENAHLEGSWIQIPSMCDGNSDNYWSENYMKINNNECLSKYQKYWQKDTNIDLYKHWNKKTTKTINLTNCDSPACADLEGGGSWKFKLIKFTL